MVNAFRHELLKLRRRSMLLGAGGSMIAIAVLGVIITMTRATSGRGDVTIATLSQPDGFAAMFQQASPLIGIVALGIVAIAVAQDYSTGMLRSMLVREPRRLRLLAGKLAADLSFTVGWVAVALVVALGVGLAIGPSRGIDTSQWLNAGLGTTFAQIGADTLVALGMGVFGAALALLLRNPAPAVIAGIAWALPVESLLGRIWSSLAQWLPVHQLDVIAARGTTAALGTAFLLTGAFVAFALVLSGIVFRRSDVTA